VEPRSYRLRSRYAQGSELTPWTRPPASPALAGLADRIEPSALGSR
jgi:hypothetical protein